MGTGRHIYTLFSQLLLPHQQLKWQSFNTLGTQLYSCTNLLICLRCTTNCAHPNPPPDLLKVDSPKACFTSTNTYLPEAFCLLGPVPYPQAGVQTLKITGLWQRLESQDFSAPKYLAAGSVCSSTKCLHLDKPDNCYCYVPFQ